MSPPDPPGIPNRNLPRGTQLPPRKDPRTDSGGAMPVLIPEQRAPRVEPPVASRRESVFSALTPDKRIINTVSVILTLLLGGGGAVAMNRGNADGRFDADKFAALEVKVETQKAEINQLKDRVRLNESRQKDFETQSATAHSQAPCVSKKVNGRTELVCGGYELDGFPANSKIVNERMDPPTFRVKLSDGSEPTPWPKL